MPTQDKGEHPAEHEFLVNFFPIEGNRVIACMGSWGIEMPRTTDAFVESVQAGRVRDGLAVLNSAARLRTAFVSARDAGDLPVTFP